MLLCFVWGDQQNTATTMRSLPLSSLTVLLLAVACTSFSSIIPSSHSFRYYSFHRLDAESDRREFLSRVGASAFLLATTTTTPSSSAAAAATSDTSGTVLVLGGTGLVGGEVVKKLKSLGLTVVATSRDGRDGTVAMDFTTTNNVATTIEQLSKGCQSVISCVGAIGTEQDDLINSATGLAAAGARPRLAGRPFRRLAPGLEHGLLGHVLGLGRVAQHTLGQGQDTRQLARDERLRRRRVALPHAPHQILVGVDDRDQTCLFRC